MAPQEFRRSDDPDPVGSVVNDAQNERGQDSDNGQDGENGSSKAVGRQAQRRIWLWVITLALVGLLIAALVLSVPQLSEVADRWTDANAGWVLLAICFELLSCISYVIAFQLVFTRVTMRFASQIAWTQLAFGAVIPSGGASGIVVGAWIIKAKGGSLPRYAQRSAVLYLLTSAINAFSLVIFGFAAGLGLLHVKDAILLGLLPGAITLLAIGLFLLAPLGAKKTEDHRPNRWNIALRAVGDVVKDTLGYLIRPRWKLLGAVGYLWFDIATMWACFRAIGIAPSLGTLVLAYLLGYLTNLIPVPGGIGVLDGGLVGVLILFGIHAAPAAAGVLMYHAIALWFPTLLGMVAFLRARREIDQPIKLKPPVASDQQALR